MRFSISSAALLLAVFQAVSAATWGFKDGSVAITAKGSGVGGGVKENIVESVLSKTPIVLGPTDSLKVLLTTLDGKTAKRAHQTYLSLTDSEGLETSFPLQVKDNGKAKLELAHKDIPAQLLASSEPLTASLIIASFGDSVPYNKRAFELTIKHGEDGSFKAPVEPLRYGKLKEIHHVFRMDPKSPPKIVSAFFTLIVVGSLSGLIAAWGIQGANASHLGKAFQAAPVAHTLYFGGIVAMEGVLFLYYTTWNLFQILPVAAAVGVVILLSGSKALTEVQDRRLAGLR